MHYIIYQITHTKSGKIYIGKHQTNDINDGYFGSGKRLIRAVRKHGRDAFTKTILFDFNTEAEMNAKERELVTEEFCRRKDTYNICEGGKGGFGYVNRSGLANPKSGGMSHSQQHMQQIAKRGREVVLSSLRTNPAFRESYRNRIKLGLAKKGYVWLGKKHTDESKQKQREAKLGTMNGEKNPQYGKHWITDGIENRCVHKTTPIPVGWRLGRVIKPTE